MLALILACKDSASKPYVLTAVSIGGPEGRFNIMDYFWFGGQR